MSRPLRLLLLEDSEDDAELILRALRRSGYEPVHRRAESSEQMRAALEEDEWEIVVSDHDMPRFSALAALELLRKAQIDVPFIIVSGAIGEETAVEAMAAGAGDYVMKDNLRRLVPAIERELREAATRATRREAELALREGEARLRAVMENVIDAILTVDSGGRIDSVNPAAERLFGRGPLVGQTLPELLTEPFRVEYEEHLAAYSATGSLPILGVGREVLARRQGGALVPIDLALSEMELDSSGRSLIVVARDISERKRAESQLRHLAEHDPLTGLPNRRRFEQEVSRQMAYGSRYGVSGAVLVLDLDNFKYVNDTLGHKAGDELIVRVARVIRDRVRDADTLARLGGDEFAILLRGSGDDGPGIAARDLLEAIRDEAFLLEGQRVRVTTSIGIAPLVAELSIGEVLARADQAMYQAKEQGRDRVAEFSPESRAEIEKSRTWAERIRRALEQELFVLHAQPIQTLADGSIRQCELLLRMSDEQGGLVLPGSFLATAERFGMIQPIDRWVVGEAIELLDSYRRSGLDTVVEVNLSGKSMDDPELLELVERELARTGIDPSRLVFEVTETMAIANLEAARALAEHLVGLGCRFALDDFGVGFASFYYLKHLPIAYLKIDGDFIRALPRSRTDQLVVKALVEIAHGLGIKTIAECVEDEETLELIRAYGVEFAQGFHIARAAPLVTPSPSVEPA